MKTAVKKTSNTKYTLVPRLLLTNLHAVGHRRSVELDQTQNGGPTVGEVTEHDAGIFGVADVAEGGLSLLLLAAEVPNSDVSVRRLFGHDGSKNGKNKKTTTSNNDRSTIILRIICTKSE